MSRSLNKVQLIGNLGADPEVRSTSNGTRVATMSIATGRQWTGSDGQKQEKTEWHRVVAWNNRSTGLADLVEKFVRKGDRIYVEGRIEYRTWEDREGKTRYTTEINVRELIMLGSRGGGDVDDAKEQDEKAAVRAATGASGNSFDKLPEALDEKEDDLPF